MGPSDVAANVVLTADTSQYDQSMTSSAQNTDTLAKSVDTLSAKIGHLSRTAGKTLLGFAAADVATITAATAAYAAFEQKMIGLNVQAATLNKTLYGQRRDMAQYTDEVNRLRRTYGESTTEAAHLVQTITKMQDATEPADKLTKSFAKLGEATQESSSRLAQSMFQLQRTMGTPQRDTEKFNNQLLTLQSRSNASASSILDFSNSIAPIGRLVNMTQTDIMGFSNAFIKAGQDGYQASNTFSKMVSDIAYATQSGSPELAKYAALVGMTTQNFKQLGGTDQILQIFDAINRQGPAAITTLNRMGYDGLRTVRTITAMSQQSGGLQAEITAARNADPNAVNRGAQAATSGLVDNLKRLRGELAETGEAFGKNFEPAAEGFLTTMTKMMGIARMVVDSPLGKMAALFAAIAAPLAAIAGTGLLATKGLMAFSAARMALTGAMASGYRDVRALGPAQIEAMNAMGVVPGIGPGRASIASGRGAQVLREGSWLQRRGYNITADIARGTAGVPGGFSGLLSRGVGYGASGIGWFERNFLMPQFQAGSVNIPGVEGTGGYNDINKRMRIFNSRTLAGSLGATPEGYWGRQMMGFRQGLMGGGGWGGNVEHMGHMATAMQHSEGSGASMQKRMADAAKFADRMSKVSDETEKMGRSAMTAQRGLGSMTGATARLVAVMGSTAVGATTFGLGAVGKGLGAIGINPWMIGIGAGIAGVGAMRSHSQANEYRYQDYSTSLNPYYQAAGLQGPAAIGGYGGVNTPSARMSLSDSYTISATQAYTARDPSHHLANSMLKDFKSPKEAEAWLSSQWGTLGKDPQAVNLIASDLIDKFGEGHAQQILNNLRMGNAAGVTTFASVAAANPGGRLWNNAGKSTSRSLNQYFDTLDLATAQTAKTKGFDTAMSMRGRTLEKGVNAYFSGTGPIGENDKQFDAAFAKQVLGINPNDIDTGARLWNLYGHSYGGTPRHSRVGASDDLQDYLRLSFSDHGIYERGQKSRTDILGRFDIKTKGKSDVEIADALYKVITNPPKTQEEKDKDKTAAGEIKAASKELFGSAGILGIASVKNAIGHEGDQNAQYQAINDVTAKLRGSGKPIGGQIRYLGNLVAASTGNSALGADIFNASIGNIMQAQAYRAPYQDRVTNFRQQSSIFAGRMTHNLGPEGQAERKQAQADFASQVQEQYNYFKNLLYQQREFDVMRKRAEYDYNLQRQYAQDDFARSRARAEQDYNIQRQRAEADFSRQMNRNRRDFNLSRAREEQDHHHQVMLMIEQQAKSMYNVYERVKVQRTNSAAWLLNNSADQARRMTQQEADLNTLRKRGLSDNAIQQLGLTDSQNQQQLSRFVTETAADPQLINQFNKQISVRLKAARNLTTDQSSQDWQEFEHQYKLARDRAQDDFEKSVTRANKDFKRQMSQQDDDFRRSLRRQQQDFSISMNRQEDAYRLSMQRSSADLARSAETIDGNFAEILTKATKKLSGHARAQAASVLDEFQSLKGKTGAVSNDLMQAIADIFGLDWHPPKSHKSNVVGNEQSGYHVKGTKNVFFAAGGVMPGYTPNRDIIHYKSEQQGAPDLSLSGGEGIMVPEWVRAVGGPGVVNEMNRRARTRRMASGGVYWPVPGHEVSTYPGHDGIDINRGSGWDDYGDPIRAFRSGRIQYAGSGHGYGNAIFEAGPGYGTVVYGHTSKMYVHSGQNVRGGQMIGLVGDSGHATAPHLHFGHPGGTSAQALALLHGALNGGFVNLGGGFSPIQSFGSFAKPAYGRIENATRNMASIHPFLYPVLSGIVNEAAKTRYDKENKKFNAQLPFGSGMAFGVAPSDTGSNQEIVRRAMQNFGWNQWGALYNLVMSESGFRNTAQNPTSTAYGMFQFLDSTWSGVGGHKTSDPALQALYGMRYIQNRYHDPNGAWAFHKRHGWYGNGAIFKGPHTIGVGERGPEAVIPLNDRGTDFMAGLMEKLSAGVEGRGGHVRGSIPAASTFNQYNYKIDRSTTFSGAITVQANNPNEMVHQLKARQRVLALSQPSLGGVR